MAANSRNYVKRLVSTILLLFIFSTIGIIVAFFTTNTTALTLRAEYYDTMSVYNDCDYDYVVRGLNSTQIDEIKALKSVSDYVSYHSSNATIKINGEEVDVAIMSLSDDSKVGLTEFSNKRVVSESKIEGSNVIYLFEQFANTYGYKLGDTIKIAGIEFKVARLYRNNESKVLYIPNFASLLKDKFDQDLSISGIYVSCSDKKEFTSVFLTNYKPLASAKKQSDFATQEEYDAYMVDFNSKDYSNYYYDKLTNYENDSEKANNYLKESNKYCLFSGLLIGGFILLGSIMILILNFKKYKTELINNGRKELNKRTSIAYLIILIETVLLIFVSIVVLCSVTKPFIKISLAFNCLIYEWILVLLFIVISSLFNFVFINKKWESIK